MRTIVMAAAFGAGCLLWAAEFWEKKPFSEWSYKEVNRVLTGSPWTRVVQIVPDADRMHSVVPPNLRPNQAGAGIISPMGGTTGYEMLPTIDVLVRWHSALIVRQALARGQFSDKAATSPKVKEFLERPQRFYVITVSKVPSRFFEDKQSPELKKSLADSASLRIEGLQEMKPLDVRIEVDAPALTVFFAFPRVQEITPDGAEAEFSAHIGPLKVKTKFKLATMVWNGKLDL